MGEYQTTAQRSMGAHQDSGAMICHCIIESRGFGCFDLIPDAVRHAAREYNHIDRTPEFIQSGVAERDTCSGERCEGGVGINVGKDLSNDIRDH
jgi:hypothetical protein